MTATTTCTACGHHPSGERPAVHWAMTVLPTRTRSYTCGPCTRTHVRAMEHR